MLWDILYRGKEKIHREIESIIYSLKWYIPTNIISLALLVLHPKLVLLLTDVLSELSLCFSFCVCSCFTVLKRHGIFYTSAIPEVTWYEPLYSKTQCWVWTSYTTFVLQICMSIIERTAPDRYLLSVHYVFATYSNNFAVNFSLTCDIQTYHYLYHLFYSDSHFCYNVTYA